MKFCDLSKVREKFTKVNVVSTTDLDGHGSAAIIYRMLTNLIGYYPRVIDIQHVDQGEEISLIDGLNIILNHTFSANSNNFQKIVEAASKPWNLVLWVDSHSESLTLLGKEVGLRKIPHVVSDEHSSTYLCWKIYEYMAYDLYAFKALRYEPRQYFDTKKILANEKFNLFDFLYLCNFENREFNPGSTPVTAFEEYRKEKPILQDYFDKRYSESLFGNVKLPTPVYRIEKKTLLYSFYYRFIFEETGYFPRDVRDPYYNAFIQPPHSAGFVHRPSDVSVSSQKTPQEIGTDNLCLTAAHMCNVKMHTFFRNLLKHGYVTKIIPDDQAVFANGSYYELKDIAFLTLNTCEIDPLVISSDFAWNYPWILTYCASDKGVKYDLYCGRMIGPGIGGRALHANDIAEIFGGSGDFQNASFWQAVAFDPTGKYHHSSGGTFRIVEEELSSETIKDIQFAIRNCETNMNNPALRMDGNYIIPHCTELPWPATSGAFREEYRNLTLNQYK